MLAAFEYSTSVMPGASQLPAVRRNESIFEPELFTEALTPPRVVSTTKRRHSPGRVRWKEYHLSKSEYPDPCKGRYVVKSIK